MRDAHLLTNLCTPNRRRGITTPRPRLTKDYSDSTNFRSDGSTTIPGSRSTKYCSDPPTFPSGWDMATPGLHSTRECSYSITLQSMLVFIQIKCAIFALVAVRSGGPEVSHRPICWPRGRPATAITDPWSARHCRRRPLAGPP